MKIERLSLCGNKSKGMILIVTEWFRCQCLASGQVDFSCSLVVDLDVFSKVEVVWSGCILTEIKADCSD